MLNRLVELSLRYKFLVLIIFAVVAFLGLRAVRDVPIDAFPDVTPAQVNIYTESPGLAAEDVELLLTTPVESALAGLPKVQEIRSVSLFGLSYVSVYFEDDMEIYFARHFGLDETLEGVERVTDDDVQRVSRDLFADGALSATVLGAVKGLQLPPERLSLG